jgi:catechol 2,3-dioxygenase-like lactoylglutathione lyase family enzyme
MPISTRPALLGSTALGVEDLTFTVSSLDEAAEFFTTVFGAVPVADSAPIPVSRQASMRALANADVRAAIRDSRLLRTSFINLRLLEAAYPAQREIWPAMLDVGGWHLAGYVNDMDAAIAFLEESDVYILGTGKKPTTNAPEVGEGSYACHCQTSWGFHFELLTYPNGRAYMAQYENRLWNPAQPDAGATLRTAAAGGLPGFRGFEHLAFAVADIGEVTGFLEEVLGCERFYDMGPVEDRHSSGFGAYANVDVRVKASKVRLFRTPYLNLEVIEAVFPGQDRCWPGLLDVGGWQLVFAVDDLDAAIQELQRPGVWLLRDPRHDDGREGGDTRQRASFMTSFGLCFDLVGGGPATPEVGATAWHPSRPDL